MAPRLVLALAFAAGVPAQERLEFPALLRRLHDPDWLWRAPPLGETCVQFSSYDRASHRGPAEHDAWYANNDRGQHLRVEERDGAKEYVMVDAKGPGCVARIWSANPSGTLHFDVDGARVWSVDFLALCSGKVEGVPEPLAGIRARGGNCYLPIPFAKSLMVSCTAGDCYYAFDVVQWAAGTEVPSFTPAGLTQHAEAVASTARVLAEGSPPTVGWNSSMPSPVRVGRRKRVVDLGVHVKPRHADVDLDRALQGVRLIVRTGGETTVDVPLMAMFASGSRWRAWRGYLVGIHASGDGYCYWPMPMPLGGSIRLAGELPPDVALSLWASSMQIPEGETDPLLFRASYHLVKGTPTRPFSDHLVLDAKGKGRFVGCSLLVRNPSRIWWGEGDEKFTVDGEAFPSWFGTGTEDYFGYAWCDPTPFQAPFHAQVECQGPGNFGFTQLHRTHVLDSVPFQQSFRFELERWHWVENANVDYATVAYWYGAPGASSGLPPVPAAADRALERLPGPPVFVAEQALEGEALRVVSCSGGEHVVQDMTFLENTFSRDAQRWWKHGKQGDRLVLAVPVATAGRYRVTMAMTRADDYAIVARTLGGHDLGAFDGFAERVTTSGPQDLGVVALPAGEAELVFTLVGANERAKPAMMVGLDWLRLEKVE